MSKLQSSSSLPIDISENHGLASSYLHDFLNEIEHLNLEVNSFILLQNGFATAQFWKKPYHKDAPQLLYSLSKSFTSIAIGIAWDQGLLNLDDAVVSFFPDKLSSPISPNLAKMKIHHLLAMNTGHQDSIYTQIASEQDWVKAFLAQEVDHEPGTHYVYNTHATYMLSAIIEQVSDENLVDFLMPRLFEPLGIAKPSWETCPLGIIAGGMGLSLKTEDIAKFGQMLLNRGTYLGKRIVSEAYLDLATTEQSDNRASNVALNRPDSMQGYGYQFHLCRYGCFRGDGSFGQMCFVAPKQNIVIAVTASFASMQRQQELLNLIYEHIIFQVKSNVVLEVVSSDREQFQHRLSCMGYADLTGISIPSGIPNLSGRHYVMEANRLGLQRLIVEMDNNRLQLRTFYDASGEHVLTFDFTKSSHIQDVFMKDLNLHKQEVVTYASWQDSQTLLLTLIYIETPYHVTYTIQFLERTIDFHYQMNVSLGSKEARFTGTLLYK
ncbi:beta-lactamase family protein [Paenibacillus sp. N1-5-1-14]|uniref:serine hydrolase domain-containing protein n=1 Tax=Paenibacillus radicibacter TaxID=2972488 RepID=UPI0021590868|nr:serine hydrolase [Paenibacillus radicibacter]MCR8644617.1 beta-lactamase family protein [Paenibacillus radicibacter]